MKILKSCKSKKVMLAIPTKDGKYMIAYEKNGGFHCSYVAQEDINERLLTGEIIDLNEPMSPMFSSDTYAIYSQQKGLESCGKTKDAKAGQIDALIKVYKAGANHDENWFREYLNGLVDSAQPLSQTEIDANLGKSLEDKIKYKPGHPLQLTKETTQGVINLDDALNTNKHPSKLSDKDKKKLIKKDNNDPIFPESESASPFPESKSDNNYVPENNTGNDYIPENNTGNGTVPGFTSGDGNAPAFNAGDRDGDHAVNVTVDNEYGTPPENDNHAGIFKADTNGDKAEILSELNSTKVKGDEQSSDVKTEDSSTPLWRTLIITAFKK